MAYLYTFPNATAPDEVFVQTASAVHSFVPMFLLFIFAVITLGGIKLQEYRRGRADYPMWAVIGGLATTMVSLIMGIIPGLISLQWTVVVVVITIFCGLWLLLDRKPQYEGN